MVMQDRCGRRRTGSPILLLNSSSADVSLSDGSLAARVCAPAVHKASQSCSDEMCLLTAMIAVDTQLHQHPEGHSVTWQREECKQHEQGGHRSKPPDIGLSCHSLLMAESPARQPQLSDCWMTTEHCWVTALPELKLAMADGTFQYIR